MSFATEGFSAMMSFLLMCGVSRRLRKTLTVRRLSRSRSTSVGRNAAPPIEAQHDKCISGRRARKARRDGPQTPAANLMHLPLFAVGQEFVEHERVDAPALRPQHHEH